MNIAILCALGAMICWGVGDFLIQKSARKIGTIEALTWVSIIGTTILFPFVIKDIANLSLIQDVLLLLLLGIVGFVSSLLDFEAMKQGKIAVIDMVISLELPLTVLLGVFFLHENISAVEFFAILALMIGIAMISISVSTFKNLNLSLEKGVLLALAAAVGMAIMNYLTAISSVNISPIMAIWFPWMCCALFCTILLLKKRKPLTNLVKKIKKYPTLIISTSIIDTGAWVFFAFALNSADLGITTAITQIYPVIALALGVTIGKEHITARQYIGAAIAITAAAILAFML